MTVNPVAMIHAVTAVAVMVASVPLMRGSVKMNRWYGVRIPAAFESEERWFELNRKGGSLLFLWGGSILGTAVVGALLNRANWLTYDWASLAIIMGGLAGVVIRIYRLGKPSEDR